MDQLRALRRFVHEFDRLQKQVVAALDCDVGAVATGTSEQDLVDFLAHIARLAMEHRFGLLNSQRRARDPRTGPRSYATSWRPLARIPGSTP